MINVGKKFNTISGTQEPVIFCNKPIASIQ